MPAITMSSARNTAPRLTSRVIATEQTPLIRRRQSRRQEQEGILNWKIVALLTILVCGVVIGIHLIAIECKISNRNISLSLILLKSADNEWPVNYPFHLINRNFWDEGESLENLNLTLLDSSQVSNVVLFHTRGDYCFNYSTCLFVINKMQVSVDFHKP